MIVVEIMSNDLLLDESLGTSVWQCWLKITDDAIPQSYMLPATAPGTLAENELQGYFDGRAASLWSLAQAKQYPIDTGDSGAIEAQGGAKVWYTANPGAQQLFTLDGATLETTIADLVAASFPGLTAQQRKQWEFLLTSLAYNDRIALRRLGLVG